MRMNQAEVAELAYASDLKSDDLLDLVGSSPTLGINATVAQLAEQRFCKPQVAGSSPVGGFGGRGLSFRQRTFHSSAASPARAHQRARWELGRETVPL